MNDFVTVLFASGVGIVAMGIIAGMLFIGQYLALYIGQWATAGICFVVLFATIYGIVKLLEWAA